MSPLTKAAVDTAVERGMNAVFIAPENLDAELGAEIAGNGLDVYLVKDVFQGTVWWERFPDCRPVDRKGKPMEIAAGWYHGVCPTHQGVRRQLLEEIDELLDLDFVKGINFNFLRFPGYWESARGRESLMEGCTCERCRKAFGSDTEGPDWERWKAEYITDFAGRLISLRDSKERRIRIGLHMIPWDDERHQGARPGALGQDLAGLIPLLDYISPMCHFGLQDESPDWVRKMMLWTKETTGKPVIPVVQGFDVSDRDFAAALSNALAEPSDGAMVFTWEFLRDQEAKLSALRAAYSG